jgi:ubiquinone/menaquinone biosynthesis C-methylase UbiE
MVSAGEAAVSGTATLEAPDVETSSEAYSRRFSGSAGAFMLGRQLAAVERVLADKRGVSILDVGGGHAQLSGPLAAAGHQVTVLGSTPACAVRLGQDGRNANVRFVTGSIVDLPFPDDSFDTVVSIRLMAHIDDWPKLVAEMCRVAKTSVVIDYPSWRSSNALSLLTFGVKKKIEGDTRQYRSFWDGEIAREFARNGKKVVAVQRQFVLPMALHRKTGGSLQGAESVARGVGLTALFGNPAILRADSVSG